MERSLITKAGYIKLKKELEVLKNEKRPEIINAIEKAREHGDLSENAEYHTARDQQKIIEKKIQILEERVANVEVVDVKNIGQNYVSFGATALLQNIENNQEISYTIVGKYEADIKNNTISILSPLAKSLIGKKINDQIEVTLPNGLTKCYKILSVEYT